MSANLLFLKSVGLLKNARAVNESPSESLKDVDDDIKKNNSELGETPFLKNAKNKNSHLEDGKLTKFTSTSETNAKSRKQVPIIYIFVNFMKKYLFIFYLLKKYLNCSF